MESVVPADSRCDPCRGAGCQLVSYNRMTAPRYEPSLETLRGLTGAGKTVPVFRRLLADRLTPVGAFARLVQDSDHAFLLESVVGGEHLARYSFVGAHPAVVFRAGQAGAWLEARDGSQRSLGILTDPFIELQRLVAEYQGVPHGRIAAGLTPLPRFTGGAVGYAAYDCVRYYERLPGSPPDDRGLDDLAFGLYDAMVVFDQVNSTMLVVAQARLDTGDPAAAYVAACSRIDEMVDALNRPAPLRLDAEGPFDLDLTAQEGHLTAQPAFESNFTRAGFEAAVRRAKEYIVAGDIFQVVLSQRLRVTHRGDPFDVYRALRVVNPSPFMFYLKSPRCTLIGASPEILCRVEDGIVTGRPLAGTRPRGRTPAEDAALERELHADPKDRAEHVMLVDLGRNDLGRVAEPGTIELSDLMSVERYSHVMHLSSNVRGRLRAGLSAGDALRAALPVGTVSGAPKVRAMQIIDELEPVRRGPYGGAVGYLDLSGNMDTCIALRTMVATPHDSCGTAALGSVQGDRDGAQRVAADVPAGRRSAQNPKRKIGAEEHTEREAIADASAPSLWTIDIQAGAGIVADSDPSAEYDETMNKAKALLKAIAVAGGT